jgi:hypothetical protein
VLATAAVLAALVVPAAADALSLVPPKPDVFLGVSDRGTTTEFNEFAELTGKHPALMETFHPWGNSINAAYERWRETATRPILHISTADDQTLTELITPEQIALGAGDDYLLQINDFFAKRGLPAYIRPLGEPNRCLNAWSAVNCDGSQKGGEHTTGWYKQAFRRISLIVRGGQSLEGINAMLAEIGLPPVQRTKGPPPTELPASPVSIVWSPLPGGSPRVKGNFPGNYWPGRRWVDWVGTDFYSGYPEWDALTGLYRRFSGKPFALAEWAVEGEDPTFVRKLFAWVDSHRRCRMLVYYQDFGDSNSYRIQNYGSSLSVLRAQLHSGLFPAYARGAPRLPPPPPGGVGAR